MIDTREAFLITILGHNRTGKSVAASEIIEHWKKNNKDGKVIAFDPQSRFKADFNIDSNNENWASELYNVKPYRSLVVLDDYKILMDNDRTPKDFLSLLNYRSEWCVDIIMITHHPQLLLERISYFVTHYIVFYTQSQDSAFNRNIINVGAIIEAKNKVNDYAIKHGKGTFKENNFRLAIVEQDTMTTQYINMP